MIHSVNWVTENNELFRALTSGVCGVSVLAQVLLVASVGSDRRSGVRVLVDQILNTFPAAKAKERAPK